jgi:hypothetical protein
MNPMGKTYVPTDFNVKLGVVVSSLREINSVNNVFTIKCNSLK